MSLCRLPSYTSVLLDSSFVARSEGITPRRKREEVTRTTRPSSDLDFEF